MSKEKKATNQLSTNAEECSKVQPGILVPAMEEFAALNTIHPGTKDHKTNGVVVQRNPVHRTETEEAATISIDVSGFAPDQLQVRLEEEEEEAGQCSFKKRTSRRPILSVTGERVNQLGDKFTILRRFVLERKNLLNDDIETIPIEANFTNDGILSIRVPKKPKKDEAMEEANQPTVRNIPISNSPNVVDPNQRDFSTQDSVRSKETPEAVTVDETK
jgi:HSP20 family molecular chaperone IbpA